MCDTGARARACICRSAVERAHAGLRAAGLPEQVAREAAVRIYRHYHPEVPAERAEPIVESWLVSVRH